MSENLIPAEYAATPDGITELRRQEALLKTGALQNAIFNSANFSSIATDEKGVIQLFNVGAERMLGYTAVEVVNKISPADISDPQELIARAIALGLELDVAINPGFEALVYKASRGIEDIYELTYIRKDSSRFPAVVSVTALRDNQNGIIGYLLIGTDNTARKLAEEALLKAGALQSAIFNSANFSSIATDAKGVIQIFNVGAERMLGYTAAEVMNKITPADISDPQEVIARAIALSLELGTPITPGFEALVFKASRGIEDIYELTYIRKDGSRFPAVVSVTALRNAQDGIIGYLLIGTDNTARKEAEDALLRAGALQSAIFNSANFSSIATDAKGVIQIFNVGAERMLGYTAAEVMNKITPADISDPQEVIARAEVLSVELGTPITPGFEALVFKASRGIEDIYELTYIRKDGSRFPAVVSVTALRDAQDTIIGYLLIGTDNTARKQASQYARSLLEASLDPLVTISPEGKITDVNEGSIKVTGMAREKLIGTDFSDYFTEPEKAREGYQQVFAMGFVTDYPLTIRHKDGRLTDVLYNASVYKDTGGTVLGVFAAARDITARKQAEEALLKAGALQSAIFNSANFSSIATDAQGVIQIFNVGAEHMLGYTAAEVMNKITPADISDPQEVIARAEALSVELRTPITPGFEALVFKASRGIEDIYELTYIRKDGSRFPAVVSVTALRNAQDGIIGYLLIGTDNTARKQIEEKLRWTEESFRLMVESVTDHALVMLDPEGRVMSWNAGAERIQGYHAEDIVGEHFSRFYLGEDVINGKPQRVLAAVMASGRFEDEGWRLRKDESSFWANVVYTAIRDQFGNLRGFAKLTRDLTERRQVEAALTDAKSAAEKANQAKSDFLSSMSHELRSPLNAILGFAQLMESDSPPPTSSQQASIEQILHGGWYLLELINEILDLAVIESGRLSLSLEPVSLVEVMRECQAMIEPQAQKRGIQMTFPQIDNPWFVNADRTRVKQVLINLLSNAIKYNRIRGTVVVECSANVAGRIRISVADTGTGLPAEKLAQLFQPFNRLGQEASAEEGTGIGLVVTKRLVELMGGVIGVESTIGVGSLFWIELVAVAAPQIVAGIAESTSVAQTQVHNDAALRTLLYVEDNPANLKLVEQLIARCPDMRLLSAADGYTGIEIARAFQPEVILMDINLPSISGIEALKILHEDPTTAHIPVVALSANAIPSDIVKGLEAGFFRYLTKPIKVNEFLSTLDEALEFAEKSSLACK